jgi:hypothetical protein
MVGLSAISHTDWVCLVLALPNHDARFDIWHVASAHMHVLWPNPLLLRFDIIVKDQVRHHDL